MRSVDKTSRAAGLLGVLAGLAACSAPAPLDPDGGAAVDARPSGLRLRWQADPAVPGMAEDDLEISSATFELRELRLIGDAAPGDERTTVHQLRLEWADGKVPGTLELAAAPAGIYSRLAGTVDGDGSTSYQVTGRVRRASVWTPYRIEDTGRVSIGRTFLLTAGVGQTEVPLEVDLGHVIDAVDFGQAVDQGGTLVMTGTNPGIAAVRAALAESFEVVTGQ